MITETITYVDPITKIEKTDTLHFHISEVVLTENIIMVDKLQEFVDITESLKGDERELESKEVQQMMDLVKWFMRISYGVRTPDGGFDQDEPAGSGEVWKQFRIHGAYPAFLMSLFRPNPAKLIDFIAGVIPESLMDQARKSQDPKIQEALRNAELRRTEVERLPRGTRIVDDVPVAPEPLRAVPEPVDENDEDFDAMLAEIQAETSEGTDEESTEGKTPISKRDHDLMRARLRDKPGQFKRFMETRYVDTSL